MEILWFLTKAWNCGIHLYRCNPIYSMLVIAGSRWSFISLLTAPCGSERLSSGVVWDWGSWNILTSRSQCMKNR